MNRGYAAIVLVMIIGLTATYLSLMLVRSGAIGSFAGRGNVVSADAFYAAQSGIEDAIWRVNHKSDYGNGATETYAMALPGGSTVNVTVSGDATNRTVKAVGQSDRYVRRLTSDLFFSEIMPGFDYAIHAGTEGFELENNTHIYGKAGTDGNVFSNAFIKGKNNNHNASGCQTSSSYIDGNAVAVTEFDRLAPTDNGVCVGKDATSSAFLYCYVKEELGGPNLPSANCPYDPSGPGYVSVPAPTPVPLPDMGVDDLKSYLTSKGEQFSGNCTADLSGGIADCTGGDDTIGNLVVNGNMTINVPSSDTLYVNGPVWVKGDLTINANGTVSIDPSVTISQIFIVDGKISSASNVVFGAVANKFLLFLSTYSPSPVPADLCGTNGDEAAITIRSNTNSVLFYAPEGCAYVTTSASTAYHGALLGKKVHVTNNTNIEYDPALKTATFGLTPGGGWQVKTFGEY